MVGTLQPLGQQFPITNDDGTPTNYFIRWAQQRQQDIGSSVTSDQVIALIDEISIKGTLPIKVTGTIASGLVIFFQGGLKDLNDVDVTTVPPTDGQILKYVAADHKWEPGTGGGGGGGSYTKIQQIVTVGGETVISFNAIPQTYSDLILNCAGATAGSGAGVFFQCNHDTGGNYGYYRWNHYGSSNSNSASNMDLVSMGADALDGEVTFSSYTGTVAKKIARALSAWGGPSDSFPQVASGEWRNTGPITSVQISISPGSYPAGCVFTLYGRG